WDDPTSDGFIRSYEVNTLSAVRMIHAFVPGMRKRRSGRVIQISTIGTTRTVSLSKELAGSGVTVNTVSPGLIRTSEMEGYLRHLGEKHGWGDSWEDIEAKGVQKLTGVRVGRMAKPEEVADLVAFLASERAAYM